MNVKLIGLPSGEQLLADVVSENGLGVGIKSPAVLLPAGQGRIALVPWLPYAETDNMTLKTVSYMIPPKTDLLNEYNSMFGSGLVIPPKELATPKLVLSE
jgi:hypothetical protein